MTVSQLDTTFLNLPNLGQILILAFCRFTEPISFSSIASYLYFMIEDFGYDSPETIYPLVTAVTICMATGQLMSSIVWGYMAENYGRKPALLLTMFFGVINPIMFGFASNIYAAIVIRLLCGILNGKIILIRTIVSDLVSSRKEFRSHAFTLLTAATYAGYVVGPMISGVLANPVKHFPSLFEDFWLFKAFPYLLPNLFHVPFVITAMLAVGLFVEETGVSDKLLLPRDKDVMLRIGNSILRRRDQRTNGQYSQVDGATRYQTFTSPEGSGDTSDTSDDGNTSDDLYGTYETLVPSISQALVKPVILTVLCDTLLHFHCTFFLQLLTMFFATPRMDSSHRDSIKFNGGLGLDSSVIGVILSTVNIFTLLVQMKLLPAVSLRVGPTIVHRIGLMAYFSYLFVPYITLIPEEYNYLVIGAITIIAICLGFAGSFAVPSLEVLLTHASPPHVLSIATGMSQAGQALGRIIGPLALGNIASVGASIDVIGLVWWVLGAFVVLELVLSRQLRDW